MAISHISINDFRNLSAVDLAINADINILYGDNGAGKTSFLEAIYFLGRGVSFRSHKIPHIIANQKSGFVVAARIVDSGSLSTQLGIERSIDGLARMKVAGKEVNSRASLAEKMPLQLITPHSYALLEGGPKCRRQFLDWGAFHVEPIFLGAWQRVQRTLRQRNTLLHQKADSKAITAWDQELVEASQIVGDTRARYIEQFVPMFRELLANLLQIEAPISIKYSSGWSGGDSNTDLLQLLSQSLRRDQRFGYTTQGPHRADICLRVGGKPAHEALSRGQQKVFVYALLLTQGLLLQRYSGASCIYLIDDLPSELDEERQVMVAQVLRQMQAQVFVTGITKEALSGLLIDERAQQFHVKQGEIV